MLDSFRYSSFAPRLRARETSNRSTLLKTGRLGIDTIAAA
jgi:hypothetical protein